MAKATVLKCDRCTVWDQKDDPVVPIGVCGPRFDLCRSCRISLMVGLGVPEAKAVRYQELSDERRLKPGVRPSLKTLLKDGDGSATATENDLDQVSHPDSEPSPDVSADEKMAKPVPEPASEPLATGEAPVDTAVEVKPVGRARKR